MRVAAQERQKKEKMPELYCSFPGCLWRTWTREGFKPCRKHGERSEAAKANDARQSAVPEGERGEQGAPASRSDSWECHDPKCNHPNCRLAF